MKSRLLLAGFAAAMTVCQPVFSAELGHKTAQEALYPVSPLIVTKGVDSIYPSVAGDFMVYSTMVLDHSGVVRVSKFSPKAAVREVKPMVVDEAIRFGVAVQDGSVGYVSNRLGPISAWMWRGHGESHLSIISGATYRGGVIPYHLNASSDGQVWCFDTPFQKVRQNEMLNSFGKHPASELIGQLWRTYDGDNFRIKAGYKATKAGNDNKFDPPSLYILDRKSGDLTMIPNAFDGTISPDGRKVIFVRETNGNYDLWMQEINGGELVQLTDSPFGDFEPAWSPDGSRVLFVSNRDSAGAVTRTSIYMMDLNTNSITRLTNASRAADGGPAWMDKDTVVFHSNRDPEKPQTELTSGWNIWQLKLK
ncbi:TolB family protein [Mariprofundus ferrooxydans]|uniref:TolB family protein n=1 Tax=Mariprofundus ferrooxydans TaxID=314344 RepID=UPI0003686E8E|nr:PD40 domain-containing protein [Mariprofundus ferrooxydans]